MDIVLRPARESDLAFSYRVKKEAFGPYVRDVGGWEESRQRRIHDDHFARGDARIIVANGEDVGTVRTEIRDGALHIHQLFVLPAVQSRGVGARCVDLVLNEARAQRLPVRLRVLRANARARAFWERRGFRSSGQTATHDLLAHDG